MGSPRSLPSTLSYRRQIGDLTLNLRRLFQAVSNNGAIEEGLAGARGDFMRIGVLQEQLIKKNQVLPLWTSPEQLLRLGPQLDRLEAGRLVDQGAGDEAIEILRQEGRQLVRV